jgi:ribonucleoside-triphosphate reductase
MTDRKKVEARLVELRGELGKVEGAPTEVYSRIVGYYRSVRNWNAGKREEYGKRLVFDMPSAVGLVERGNDAPVKAPAKEDRDAAELFAPDAASATAPGAPSAIVEPDAAGLRDGVLVFTREACPNCPPVANYVVSSGMKAVFVDVDGDEGLALARDYGVMATPTVLAIDGNGREAFRAFDLKGLRSRFESSAPAGAP